MSFLDASGTFLSAMGSVKTPGYLQTILNQTLIPMIMLTSFFALGTRFSPLQISGASLIVIGALVSSFDSLLNPSSSAAASSGYKMSLIFYLCSNLPYALSAVYKEVAFKNQKTDVVYLTQQVSIYQMLIGIAMLPLTSIPGVANEEGMSVAEAASTLDDGLLCYLQLPHSGCAHKPTFVLLTGYCLLNFIYNTLGLYLTKAASSTVNAITSSLLLPITTLAFTLPILGNFREDIKRETFMGLVIIVIGFLLYQYGSSSGSSRKKSQVSDPVDSGDNLTLLDKDDDRRRFSKNRLRVIHSPAPIASFQERIVGIKIKHGTKDVLGFNGCVGGGGGYGVGGMYGSLDGGFGEFKRVQSFDSRFSTSI